MSFKSGQEVWLVDRGDQPKRVTVDRVGRKYAYVRRYNYDEQFSITTGHSTANPSKFIETDEMRVDRIELHKTRQHATQVGLRLDYATQAKLTTEQLNRIIAIIEENN